MPSDTVVAEILESELVRRALREYVVSVIGVGGTGKLVLECDIKDGACRSFAVGGTSSRKSLTP